MSTEIDTPKWIKILQDNRITRKGDLKILMSFHSLKGKQGTSSHVAKLIGYKGEKKAGPVNSQIAKFAKRIAGEYPEIIFSKRKNGKKKYWDLFFEGWPEEGRFIWKLKPSLQLALEEISPTRKKHSLDFFLKEELKHFHEIAGRPYRKSNSENRDDGVRLRPLIEKLNYWANQSLIENFEFKEDRHWQWSGTFKSYLWLRLFKSHSRGLVYFVFGVNKDGFLYIELNCQTSNHTKGSTQPLPEEKIRAFKKYLNGSKYPGKKVFKVELPEYNWERLIDESRLHLIEYTSLYDELASVVYGDFQPGPETDLLIQRSPPKSDYIPEAKKRVFKGRKIDWDLQNRSIQRLGIAGEELVIKHEKLKLQSEGLLEEANSVKKKMDGVGYDILSWDEAGKEIHIEVKTTKGDGNTPFFMSLNEVEYLKQNPENYYLYRLYNFKFGNRTAEFFVLSGSQLLKANFSASVYKVFP